MRDFIMIAVLTACLLTLVTLEYNWGKSDGYAVGLYDGWWLGIHGKGMYP